MGLFRTSGHNNYLSLIEFVDTQEMANAIIDINYNQDIKFYNYTCGFPVDKYCTTRFGYLDCPVRPLYLCEMPETTFFEYSYWLLKDPSLMMSGIRAYLYEVDIEVLSCPVDIEMHSDRAAIMNIKDKNYVTAHSFMRQQALLPDCVRYNSIRNPNPGGVNFAFFKGLIQKSPITEILNFSLSSKNNELILTSNSGHYRKNIKPLI